MSSNQNYNPFDALITTRSTDELVESAMQNASIIDNISSRTGQSVTELSGEYYYDPQQGGFVDDTKNDYSEAVAAERNLNVVDMPVGLSGLKNRKRFLDRARAITGLSSTFDFIHNRATIDNLHRRGMQEYSDSGWIQMGRGALGVIDMGFADMTGDTQRHLSEVRNALADSAEDFEREFLSSYDDEGYLVDRIEFTPDIFIEAVGESSPEARIAMEQFGITAKDLEGVTSYSDAVEALATKLWEQGQMQRAQQQDLTTLETVGKFFHNLGNMVLQDPDMSAEIAMEVGGGLVVGAVSAGAAVPGYIAARIAARAGRAAKAGVQVAKLQRKLARWERREDSARRVADWVAKINQFKPGMSFGGNVFEAMARKGAFGSWRSQNAAFAVGQLFDGFIGGAGARLRSNAFLQQEAMDMYGDMQGIRLTDNAALEGAFGMGFSLALGSTFRYGGRFFLNRFRTDKQTIGFDDFAAKNIENAKSEEARISAIYGEDPPAGVKAWQAERNARNEAMFHISLLTEQKVDGQVDRTLNGFPDLIGNLNSGIPVHQLVLALRKQAGDLVRADGTIAELSPEALANNILRNRDFLRALETQKRLTPEDVKTIAELQRASLAQGAKAKGVDLELEALLARGIPEKAAIAQLKKTRLKEIDTKKAQITTESDKAAKTTKQSAEGKAKAEQDKLDKAVKEAERKAAEDNKKAQEARARANALSDRPDAPDPELEKAAQRAEQEAKDLQAKRDALVDRMEKEDLDPKTEGDLRDELRELDKQLEDLDTKAKEARQKANDSGMKSDEGVDPDEAAAAVAEADEAEATAAASTAAATQVREVQQTFDFDEAVARATQEADKQEEIRQRELAELDRRRKEINEDPEGAGGMDDTALVHIKKYKQQEADLAYSRLERALKAAEDEKGNIPVAEVHRIFKEHQARWTSNPEVFGDIVAELEKSSNNSFAADIGANEFTPKGVDKYKAMAKKALEEDALDINDGDLRVYHDLESTGELAKAELWMEAKQVEDAARHRIFMAASRDELTGDPAKFEAAAVRTMDEADELTIIRRRNVEDNRQTQVKSLEADIAKLKAGKAKLEGIKAPKEDIATLRKAIEDEEAKLASLLDEAEFEAAVKKKTGELVKEFTLTQLRDMAKSRKAEESDIAFPPYSKLRHKDLAREIAEYDLAKENALEVELSRQRLKELTEETTTVSKDSSVNEKAIAAVDQTITRLESRLATLKQEIVDGKSTYSRQADVDSLREAEIKVAALQRLSPMGRDESEVGLVSHDALLSAFNFAGSSLRDIDLARVFGKALVTGKDTRSYRFNLAQVRDEIRARLDTVEEARIDPDRTLSPEQLRLRQAQEVADWRASRAAVRAEQHRADGLSGINGAKDAAQYEKDVIELAYNRMKQRSTNKNAKHMRSLEEFEKYVKDTILPHMDGEIVDLGNGVLDFVPARTAALAIADVLMNRPTGHNKHKASVPVENEVTGEMTSETSSTDFSETISHAQPANDREIARILQRMEYDARMEEIVKLDFDDAHSPSLEQVMDFIKGQELRQDRGRVLNREELALRAFWIPPQLRTGLDRLDETIDQRIDRVTEELLEENYASYDLIHDDFGTRKGDFGVNVENANGQFFKNHGVGGGFPVATAMPNPDEGYSFGMAVLDAHAILHPQTMNDTLAAQIRGRERLARLQELEAKQERGEATPEELDEIATLRSSSYVRNIDGNQNGVRHAHAMAMIDSDAAIDDIQTLVNEGTGEKRDFYEDLRDETRNEFSKREDREAKVWVELGVLEGKPGRKFAKGPVMILPYGAGKTSIRNYINKFLSNDMSMDQKKAFDDLLKREGITRSEAVEYLLINWYGNAKKKKQGLIRKALDLPESDVLIQKVLKDRQQTDPFEILEQEGKTRSEKLKNLADWAVENHEKTGIPADVAIFAVQIEARAKAIMRSEQISKEQAQKLARESMAKEMNLVHGGDRAKIEEAAKKGELGFFENVLRILQRVEFEKVDNERARAVARQTGQDPDLVFSLPSEAEGSMFFQQLMDWRTRMVTPDTKEGHLKGRKSRRGMLDIWGLMEGEGEVREFKTSEAEARADLRLLDEGKMTEDEWFLKHIDEEKTIGSGVLDFKERPKNKSKRNQIEDEVHGLNGKALDNKLARFGFTENDAIKNPDLLAKQDWLIAKMLEVERLRIKKLVVKSAMAELAPEFAPPTRLDAEGNVAQMPRLTEAQKMDRWQNQSDDVARSSDEAYNFYSRLDDGTPEGAERQAAYRKSYGLPHRPLFDANGNSNIDKATTSKEAFAKIEEAGEARQTAKTMGGMLGARAIHPTEATDMMLGVPALRLAAQNRTMGKKPRGGDINKTEARQIESEKQTVTALERIKEGGDLFSREERHRVTHTDASLLPEVNSTEEAFDPSVMDRYPPEVAEQMIETTLTRHAKKYGLDKYIENGEEVNLIDQGRWGDIYAHMVWARNVKNFGKEITALDKLKSKVYSAKTEAEREQRIEEFEKARKDLQGKWQKVVDETNQAFEDSVDALWKSHELDPFDNITQVTAFGPDGKQLTRREAIIESAQLDRRKPQGRRSRQAAGKKTNIDLIDDESLDGMRYAGGTKLPEAVRKERTKAIRGALPLEGRESNLKEDGETHQGFGRSSTIDYNTGQVVDMAELSDNQILQVHYVHAKDRAAAIGSVGLNENVSRLAGLHVSGGKPYTVAEINAMVESGEMVPGANGNVRFFTGDGVEVVDGAMIGHNIRRNATRNEAFWIMQNSSNRFLGDRLAASALAGKTIRREASVWRLMDDRVRNKDQATQLANENRMVLKFLQTRQPDAVQESSFLGAIMDMHAYWARDDFRRNIYLSDYNRNMANARNSLGVELREIENPLNMRERQNLRLYYNRMSDNASVPAGRIYRDDIINATKADRIVTKSADDTLIVGGSTGADNRTVKRWLAETEPAGKDRNPVSGKQQNYYTKKQLGELGRLLKDEGDAFDPSLDPLGNHRIGEPVGPTTISANELNLAKEVAGILMMTGDHDIALDGPMLRALAPHIVRDAETTPDLNMDIIITLANDAIEHHRKSRKLVSMASKEGITGLGVTPIVLRLAEDGIIDLDKIDDDALLAINKAWHDHETGGSKRGRDSLLDDDGKIKQSTRTLYTNAVSEAKRVLNEKEPDPFTDRTNRNNYVGEFVDQNGVKRDAEFFMEGKNFRALSDAHARFDDFLEQLLESGTLALPDVRMLRVVGAQLDHQILHGLKFEELASLDFKAEKLGLPSASGSKARGLSYSNKGVMGLTVLKGRIGRDLTAVDVILHEVGHVAQNRLFAEGSPDLMMIRSMAQNPEGKAVMKDLVKQMHGGKFTSEAAKAYDYYTAKGNEDEFLAAWFSYTMMARTLDDKAVITAAYRKHKNWGSSLASLVRKIAAYAYRRIAQFSRTFSKADPQYMKQMNAVVDAFTGKTDMPKLDRPRDFAAYHADAEGKADDIRAAQSEIDKLNAHGAEADHPARAAAESDLQDIIDDALDSALPAEFDGDGLGPRTLRDYHAMKVEEKFTDPDGIIDFGRMVDEDPIAAEQWIAIHVLPMLQEGQYAEVPSVSREMAERRELTNTGRALSRFTTLDNVVLSKARASHTVNSKVQLKVGDATYSIMQLLAELMDNGQFLTKGRLNGNPFMTLHGQAKALETNFVRPIAILDDQLRVEVAKDMGKRRARISRSAAANDQEVAGRMQELRSLAGALLLPKTSNKYKAAKAEFDALPEGKMKQLISELSDTFNQNSARIKRAAVDSRLVGAERAATSGAMPLRLKVEHMTDKAREGGWGPRVTSLYETRMLASNKSDVDTLIATGLLPTPGKVRTSVDVINHLKELVSEDLVDNTQLRNLIFSGKLEDITDAIKAGRIGDLDNADLPFTPEGMKAYRNGVSKGSEAYTPDGNTHMQKRFQEEVIKSKSKAPKVFDQTTSSGAQLRALRLGRKVGSTSYFHGGDIFVSLDDLIDNVGDMLDFDVRTGAAALQRGIGLEAMDTANMSKAYGGTVKGLSVKSLLKLLDKVAERGSTDDSVARSMRHGLEHLNKAYEKLTGGLPTVEQTGNIVTDGLARNATDLAMLSYGGNLGVAMLAETAATIMGDVAPRMFTTPVKTMAMSWRALTESLSPIRKTQVARQLAFGMHVARDTVSARSLIREVDDLDTDGRPNLVERTLRTAASASSKLSMAPTIQSLNKGFAASGAMDDLLTHISSARKLKELLDERSGVADKAEFKRLAKEAGFGRNWTLALAMQDARLLDFEKLDAIEKFATTSGATQTRIIDLDAFAQETAGLAVRGRRAEVVAADGAIDSMRHFIEDRIARHNVEPRVLDMNLIDNSGWNKIMDIFLSWPRAFYSQKSGLRGGQAFAGGLGHIASFYMAQTMWDSMYTTLQELAKGEDPDKIIHEVENDPVGWFMHKAMRMPLAGIYSEIPERMMHVARDQAAKNGVEGFGYHMRSNKPFDLASSPAGAALNGVAELATAIPSYGLSLLNGTASINPMKDRQLQDILGSASKYTPGMNMLLSQTFRQLFFGDKSKDRHGVKGPMYYEFLQMKRAFEHEREKLLAGIR